MAEQRFMRASALASVLRPETWLGASRTAELVFGERCGWSLVEIAAFAGTEEVVARKVEGLTGLIAPNSVAIPARGSGNSLIRVGHEKFWVFGSEGSDLAARAIATLDPAEAAVTPLSHSRSIITIAGPPVFEVLKKGIALDFSDAAFPVGAAAMTGVHHVPVLLIRTGEESIEVVVLRTFGRTVFEWLLDAGLEFGYRIATT